ncbi:S24/S26 family peptidase [Natrinema salifodinae]|uniref:Signal peptidase, endoplasmic reticulum-type n=1 Tax=Natrinema salifodinae TaxID=1202768 RepID=A0A1I0QFY8_9EURY|nr:S26 family signal peptidase [Natrinema salifodinae]SEW26014.1 signal peptidase, endoplasmic reticulum-type [Natrinema salifodinae]
MSGSSSGQPPGDGDSGDDRNRQDRSTDGARTPGERPAGAASSSSTESNAVTIEDDGIVRWFLKTDDESIVLVRDVLSSVAIVAIIGLVLFAVSGIWPPLVAVESGSMEPHMHRGDLVFVADEGRFVGDNPADGTGVVTLENGQESGHEKFNNPGDVIVFQPNGNAAATPVIHRAHFWVEEDERWVETKANEEVIGDATCAEVQSCPAPHDGFVTKGDNNAGYDQYGNSVSTVVKPEWVTGKAMFRIPWLGHVRLTFDQILGGMLAPTSPAGSALYDPMLSDPAATSAPAATGPAAAGLGAELGSDGELAGAAGIAATGASISGGAVVALGRRRTGPR